MGACLAACVGTAAAWYRGGQKLRRSTPPSAIQDQPGGCQASVSGHNMLLGGSGWRAPFSASHRCAPLLTDQVHALCSGDEARDDSVAVLLFISEVKHQASAPFFSSVSPRAEMAGTESGRTAGRSVQAYTCPRSGTRKEAVGGEGDGRRRPAPGASLA